MIQFIADTDHPITLSDGDVELQGLLHLPRATKGLIIFAHGSGSGRLSPRNQMIASTLQQNHLATFLFDLLTKEEEAADAKTMEFRFDIEFLAMRLLMARTWALNNPVLHALPIGYFGASTGAGAALLAAVREPQGVKAIVSRGGRPDLAGFNHLPKVHAATLLIVGGNDETVIDLNQQAFAKLTCEKKLEIIPHASHLFEEPGALPEVAKLSAHWFNHYL